MRGSQGFALFETLVAGTILSAAGLYLALTLAASIERGRHSREAYAALLAAENVLWEWDSGNPAGPGTFEDAGLSARWSWTAREVSPVAGGALRRNVAEFWRGAEPRGPAFLEASRYEAR